MLSMLMFLHPQHLNLESLNTHGAEATLVQSLWHLRWQDCVKASNQSFQVGNPPVKPSDPSVQRR